MLKRHCSKQHRVDLSNCSKSHITLRQPPLDASLVEYTPFMSLSDFASTVTFVECRNYMDVLVRNLGLLPFTEKKLSMSLANTFEPASTPSRIDRADKSNGTVQTPLYHLFSILCSKPPGLADDEDLAECFLAVFDPFFQGKSSRARVELSREMLRLLPRDALSPYGPWVLAAQNIRTLLDQNPSPSGSLPPSSDVGVTGLVHQVNKFKNLRVNQTFAVPGS